MSSIEYKQTTSQLIEELKLTPLYNNQIVAVGVQEEKNAEYQKTERPIANILIKALQESGIEKLYSHQATAFDLVEAGNNIVITSGTSSGKTLCYALPVLNRLIKEPAAAAIFIFPTKALAQDQLQRLRKMLPKGIRAETYDGDTPKNKRAEIRKKAHIIFTNPDMLHVGIIPYHHLWSKHLRSLRYIVIDEMHAYSGLFGSHTSMVLRRLHRIAQYYGAKPQWIATSATIGNPIELFQQLTAQNAETIEHDGAPRAQQKLVLWNIQEIRPGQKTKPNTEVSQLLATLLCRKIKTLAFAKSRLTAEVILKYTKQSLATVDEQLPNMLESYRSGYTKEERREIEQKLFSGELMGLSCTEAMELGVDIGTLDAVIMNGFPGSIASMRQQAGRAGRGTREGIAFMVGHDNPLDQFYMRHPEILLAGKPEEIKIRPSNPYILAQHIICAAYEKPLTLTELEHFPENALEITETLEKKGSLVRKTTHWIHPSANSPAWEIDIRSDNGPTYTIFCDQQQIGNMEQWRAFQNAHAGAIYLHRGEQYEVKELSLEQNIIKVKKDDSPIYTQSIATTTVHPIMDMQTKTIGEIKIDLLRIHVQTQVTAYKIKSLENDEVLAINDLQLPTIESQTVGVRLEITGHHQQTTQDFNEGVHAIEHLLVALAPSIANCSIRDLGSTFYATWPATEKSSIYIFDGVKGGSGISESLFQNADIWLKRVAEQITHCTCQNGCPSCVLSPRCPYSNEGVSKNQAALILKIAGF